jgi:hypothetical protein
MFSELARRYPEKVIKVEMAKVGVKRLPQRKDGKKIATW